MSEPRRDVSATGGARAANIFDVARLAGVSHQTVSRVINDSPLVKPDTRAKVHALMREYGYVPDPQARGLAFRPSRCGTAFVRPQNRPILPSPNLAIQFPNPPNR